MLFSRQPGGYVKPFYQNKWLHLWKPFESHSLLLHFLFLHTSPTASVVAACCPLVENIFMVCLFPFLLFFFFFLRFAMLCNWSVRDTSVSAETFSVDWTHKTNGYFISKFRLSIEVFWKWNGISVKLDTKKDVTHHQLEKSISSEFVYSGHSSSMQRILFSPPKHPYIFVSLQIEMNYFFKPIINRLPVSTYE